MNLVFQARGLSVGEGAFLMACCNHTDAKGYVIASMQQLADEAHMKMTAAKANKQRLISCGLLAAGERYSAKNGARIADLYRVNLDRLASMKRTRTEYGPTLIEELSFGTRQEKTHSASPSESDGTPGSDPDGGGSESDGGGSDPDGARGSESDPLLLPSSSPSSLSPVLDDAEVLAGSPPDEREREAAAPGDHTVVPTPAARTAQRVAEAWAAGLKNGGRPPMPRRAQAVGADAARLLAAGHSLEHLCQVAEWMGRAKPTWRILEDALTWPEAPQPPSPASGSVRGGMRRQDAIDACEVCDAYGQIELGGRVRMCRHDGETALAPAVPQQPTIPAPRPAQRHLGDLLRAMRQPALTSRTSGVRFAT